MKLLQLTRLDYLNTGIFGTLIDPDTMFAVFVAEHAYPVAPDAGSSSTSWAPKVPKGVYKCLRGHHQLPGMPAAFETFELQNVPGHSGILFHSGNLPQIDSEGCLLLGLDRQGDVAVLDSKEAFSLFMKNLEGLNEFTLEIS